MAGSEASSRVSLDRIQLSGKREVHGHHHATVGFQEKIAHLDEAVAREPTRKKTHALEWLPTRAGVRIDVDIQSDDSDASPSDDEHRHPNDHHYHGRHHQLTDSDDSSDIDNTAMRRRARDSQSGVSESGAALGSNIGAAGIGGSAGSPRRVKTRHNKRHGSRRLRRLFKKLTPTLRYLLIWGYIAGLIWSCDAVVDVDFSVWDVLLRGVPAYLFTCLIFTLMFTYNHRTARLFAKFCNHQSRKKIQSRPRLLEQTDRSPGAPPPPLPPLNQPIQEHSTSGIQSPSLRPVPPPPPLAPLARSTTTTLEESRMRPLSETTYPRFASDMGPTSTRQSQPAPGPPPRSVMMVPPPPPPPHQLGSGRFREGILALGEMDWQNLTQNIQHYRVSRRPGDRREMLKTLLENAKKELRAIANHPSSVLGTIFRNVVFCIIVYFTLSGAHRESKFDSWDYSGIPRELRIWDAVLQFTLVSDHILCYISATSKLNYLLRFKSIIDLCTLPLIYKIIVTASGWSTAEHGLLNDNPIDSSGVKSPERLLFSVIRLLRLFRLESLLAYSIPSLEPVTLILLGLALDSWIILSVFASLMYLLEAPIHGFVNLFDYLYYAVVTMTTVGYGDFSPGTFEGRIITMAAILTAFVVLPYQVQRLLSAIHIPPSTVGYQPRGATTGTSHSRNYILIYGKVRPRQLGIMMNELVSCIPTSLNQVWVVTPFPAIAFKSLVSKFLREHNIKLGVSQKYPTTEEIQTYAQNAKAVYILGDAAVGTTSTSGGGGGSGVGVSSGTAAFSSTLISDDQRTFLRAFKIQSACWPKVPLSVQLVHGMYSGLALELGVYNVVSLELLKLRCIAKTVSDCQGFIPLVFNWFLTPSPRGRVTSLLHQLERRIWEISRVQSGSMPRHARDNLLNQSVTNDVGTTSGIQNLSEDGLMPDEVNFHHFFLGLKYHAYRMELPDSFYGLDYSLVVRTLYRRYQVFFIGLMNLEKKIFLNPIGHVLGSELSLNVSDMRTLNQAGDKSKIASALASALGRNRDGEVLLSGIILATSIDIVKEIAHLDSLDINEHTEALEKQFINQNMRSQPELILATKTFAEDIRVTREEMAAASNLGGADNATTRSETEQQQHNYWRHSSMDRCDRALSAFNTAALAATGGGGGIRSTHKRNSMEMFSPTVRNGGPIRNWMSIDRMRSSPKLLAPPPIEASIDETFEKRRPNANSPSPSSKSSDSTPNDDDDAFIKEIPNAFHFIENSNNFILCCGWPKDLYIFLNALGSTAIKVLILSSHDAPGWGRWNRDLRNFTEICAWIHGSPLSVEDLKNAGALLANSIVIFCDSHAFCVPGEPELSTTIDNQTILVRQQLHALFSRVTEYLIEHNANEGEAAAAAGDTSGAVNEEPLSLKLPLIVTELQERESLDYLSGSSDTHLLGALRNVASRKELGRMLPRNDDERGDDIEWAREGGRIANSSHLSDSVGASGSGAATEFDVASALKFQLNRSQLDCSSFAMQSEFRAGKVYFRELGYSLIAFGLPISRYAVDASLIEHCIDGCQSTVCDYISRIDLRNNKRLQRYQWKSPLHLIPLPKLLHNAVFREVFNYCFKFQSRLPIGVLRKFTDTSRKDDNQQQQRANPFSTFSANSDEIVISCPSPDFRVIAGDRLYVFSATPKHVLGMLLGGVRL